jgi:hypothetical protein
MILRKIVTVPFAPDRAHGPDPQPRTHRGLFSTHGPNALGALHVIQKSRFLETEETLANDDVIQEIDLKNLRRGRNAFGDC